MCFLITSDAYSMNGPVGYTEFQSKLSFVFHLTDEVAYFCTRYSQDICKIGKKSEPCVLKCLKPGLKL